MESTSEEYAFITGSEEERQTVLEKFWNEEDQESVAKQVKDVTVNDSVLEKKNCNKKTVKYFVALPVFLFLIMQYNWKVHKKKLSSHFQPLKIAHMLISVLPKSNIGRLGEVSFNSLIIRN